MTRSAWMIMGGVVLMAAGAGIYFLVLRKKKVESDKYGNLKFKASSKEGVSGGVQTGKEQVNKVEPDWENPFDREYAKDVQRWLPARSIFMLKSQSAKDNAKQLYTAKGVFDDDEEAVRDVFKNRVKDKVQVSNVSQAFYTLYKRDLYDYLASFLNESEMEQYVLSPVRNLPNYRLA